MSDYHNQKELSNSMNKLLVSFIPIILFFVTYKFYDIYAATGVAIVASIVQIGWLLITKKEIDAMNWLSFLLILVFGGMTIFFHNEVFLKIKPTILYVIFSAILWFGLYIQKKNYIQILMSKGMDLPQKIWDRNCYNWSLFFLFCAALNLFVAFSGIFTESQWVNFKTFIMPLLIFIFVMYITISSHKYINTKD